MSVHIYLADGFEEIEALTAVDILRRAGIDAKTVSVMDEQIVEGAHGVRVEADLMFSESSAAGCEMIVLPGGMPGAANLQDHKELEKRILSFAEKGKWLAAICAAPMVYGELGLLKNREAICYPGMEAHLKGARISAGNVAQDGNFVTGKGPGLAAEFALKLVEVLCGKEKADSVAADMLLK